MPKPVASHWSVLASERLCFIESKSHRLSPHCVPEGGFYTVRFTEGLSMNMEVFQGPCVRWYLSLQDFFFFIILVKSSVRNLSGIKVCRFCLSICLLSASLDQCIFSGYVQHIESVAITHTVIRAGCQTHFNSWAPSRASFDLKWAGPVKQLHNNLKKSFKLF